MQSKSVELNSRATGTTFLAVTASTLGRLLLDRDAIVEQRAITKYLDRETARIDELIAEQEAVTSSLRERRSAAISVLADNAAYPTIPLGRLLTRIRQGWSPNCEAVAADGVTEWGVLKTGCVNGGVFRATENKRLPEDEPLRIEHSVRPRELVMSRASTSELVGSAARVPDGYPRLLLSDLTYGLSFTTEADPDFLVYALASGRVRGQIYAAAKGTSASMQKISQRDVKELLVRLPPAIEQARIVANLHLKTQGIDALVGECRDLITLLKERRSALITAAVTGKIDVRTS